MLNPATPQKAIQAVLILFLLPFQTTAWYMQQATTQNIPHYRDGRRSGTETAYLSQSGDEPLNFQSCITINWGNLNDNTKVKYFSFARDPPQWDDLKEPDENLANSVRGVAFFEGANCEPLTTRIMFRLADNYQPGSFLFLNSAPVEPPLRLGSWKPIWLFGQEGYSDSLSKIEVPGFRLLPPPRQLARLVEKEFPLINMARQQQQQQQNLGNIEPRIQVQQQEQPGLIRILPSTLQETGDQGNINLGNINQGNLNQRNQGNRNQAGQIRQQINSDPRDQITFNEIIREDPEKEDEEIVSPRNPRLQELTNKVENLQRLFNNMVAERENARNNPDPTDEIFPTQPNNLIISPENRSQQGGPGYQINDDDIGRYFGTGTEELGDPNYGKEFWANALQRSNSGALYPAGSLLNPLSRQASFNFQFREPDGIIPENQRDIIQDTRVREATGEQSPRIQEEQLAENNQQAEPNSNEQRAEGENNAQARDPMIEESVQNQGTGSQAQIQANTQLQENQPTINNQQALNTEIEMPPPSGPPRHQFQAGTYPFDIGPTLENNRLRYAQSVNNKLVTPYLDNIQEILARSGELIQQTLVLMAKDTNVENTDRYIAEIERLVHNRKIFLTYNDDRCLEAVKRAGKKLKEDNAIVIGPLGGNQQNAGQQSGVPRYGGLNGGMKREDM
ncbi:hypothetical protein TWF506_011453 [Arthrobotrys conoides]|uniref:Uncharacterized protein n=1 Tax=Arthrobotrys conoides TaxID=74498 RepID=A0AAN8NJU4_9PEZI